MLKIVSLFLVFMAVLAMFGRLRFPGRGRGRDGMGNLPRPRVCGACGRYSLRGGPCRHCKPPGDRG